MASLSTPSPAPSHSGDLGSLQVTTGAVDTERTQCSPATARVSDIPASIAALVLAYRLPDAHRARCHWRRPGRRPGTGAGNFAAPDSHVICPKEPLPMIDSFNTMLERLYWLALGNQLVSTDMAHDSNAQINNFWLGKPLCGAAAATLRAI